MYIYAKGWPGINLGASHESCAHPAIHANCIDLQSYYAESMYFSRSTDCRSSYRNAFISMILNNTILDLVRFEIVLNSLNPIGQI